MNETERESWKREVEMAAHTLSQFGNKIKARMADENLSLRKLSELLGIDHVVLHRVAKGDLIPHGRTLDALLDWVYAPKVTDDGGA